MSTSKANLLMKLRDLAEGADRGPELLQIVENLIESQANRLTMVQLCLYHGILKAALGPTKLQAKMLKRASEAGKMTGKRLAMSRKAGLL